VIRLLLDASCDVSITDSPYEQTPLHVAAKYSHAETCRQLLLANADPAVTNNARKTPLQLLLANADPAVTNIARETPLQVASSEDVKAILMASVSESDGSAQLAEEECRQRAWESLLSALALSDSASAAIKCGNSECDTGDRIGLANVSMAGYKKKTGMYNGRLEDGVVSGDGVLQGDD
ncbi:hypothetical protein T484DRAFT_1796766, partial [Baffinella frigidus]